MIDHVLKGTLWVEWGTSELWMIIQSSESIQCSLNYARAEVLEF